jgi:MFS family permease
VPIWLAGGVANGGDNVFNNLLLARRVPEAARGRAFAVFGAAVQGAGMAGYLAGGLLLAVAEPRPLVAACGVVGVVVFFQAEGLAVERPLVFCLLALQSADLGFVLLPTAGDGSSKLGSEHA